MRKLVIVALLFLLLGACSRSNSDTKTNNGNFSSIKHDLEMDAKIPVFDHIVLVVLENRGYSEVIGNKQMPYLNKLATEDVLLSQYYAIRHPSLPNYLGMVGGSTFNISADCKNCYLNEVSLADRIEAAGRTWKTYQEDMPSACFLGDDGKYVQRHNPFVYFDSIRLDPARCQHSVVPLSQLTHDLAESNLPDFAFISPNLCHSGHDCGPEKVDQWLKQFIEPLRASPALGEKSLIVITYDEARLKDEKNGGRVATILISPLAKKDFIDSTRLSHYSLLKTILYSWHLPGLGETNDLNVQPIEAPWN